MPCALAALRTTKASSLRPRAAAACSIAPATGSAPMVSPPTASKSRSAVRSSSTCPTSGAASPSRVIAAQVDVVVGLQTRGEGHLAVHHGLVLDLLQQRAAYVHHRQLGAAELRSELPSRRQVQVVVASRGSMGVTSRGRVLSPLGGPVCGSTHTAASCSS